MSQTQSNIPWSVHDIQEDFCKSTARYRTLVAGRRFGKNHAAIVSESDFALNPRDYPFGRDNPSEIVLWWIGPTYTQTKKYGFEKAKEAIPDQFIKGDPKETSPFEIEITNGVTWEFYSFDRPQSLDGAGVDSMVIDERGYMDTSVWENNLAAMLLDTDGRVSFIGKPWNNEHFEETFEKGQGSEYENYDSWHATSYDNPLIPDERIDEIFGDLPEQIFNREILAQFDAGGNMLTPDMLSYADPDTLNSGRYNWIVYADIGVEMDSRKARENDTDYWAVAIVADHEFNAPAYVMDVRRRRGQSPSEAARWISDTIMPDVPTNTVHFEDVQAQKWFMESLRDEGIQGVGIPENRPKEERISFLSVPFNRELVKLVDWSDTNNPVDWEDFKDEWKAFPDGDHDDMLDAVEGAIDLCDFGGRIDMQFGDMYGREDDEDDNRGFA